VGSAANEASWILKGAVAVTVLRDAGSLRKVAVGGVVQIKNLPRCTRRDALDATASSLSLQNGLWAYLTPREHSADQRGTRLLTRPKSNAANRINGAKGFDQINCT
jgi:hypothetical protein